MRLVAPPGAAEYLTKRGFEDVTELEPGDEHAVGAVTVRATYADHPGARMRGSSGIAVGYVLEGSRRVYFAGDTDVFPEMAELGPVDCALLPIWGWGPTLGPGHLNPESAAEAAALLRRTRRRADPLGHVRARGTSPAQAARPSSTSRPAASGPRSRRTRPTSSCACSPRASRRAI